MLIVSQNLRKYEMPFPPETIFRINLAWINSTEELTDILNTNIDHQLFLDLPVGRIKPPHNKYSIKDLISIIKSYDQIKYFAVSNVESPDDLAEYIEALPKSIVIVPKIESLPGIINIKEILESIPSSEKIIMLDHDDLFSYLERKNEPTSEFRDYIHDLEDFCKRNNVTLLRTRGVIFSDKL